MATPETTPAGRYEYGSIIDTLKRVLKRKKITYRELAARMGMSESGVKKIMAAPDGSISRLSDMCDAAEVDLFAVMELAWRAPPDPFTFSSAQDAWFARHPNYYYFFVELHSAKGDPEKVGRTHDLDSLSVQRYVDKLEELGLLHVLTSGRIRFAPDVTDRMRNGPKMRKTFGPRVQHRLVDQVHKAATASAGPVFPETMFVTASLRMTKQRLIDMNRALHETVLRFGTDARQDELGAPERSLVNTGLLVVSATAEMSAFYDIPRLTRRTSKSKRR